MRALMLVAVMVAILSPIQSQAAETVPFSTIEWVRSPESPLPFTDTIVVPADGQYRVLVTDFGVAGTPVAPAGSIRLLAIDASGAAPIDVDTTGEVDVNLTAGEFQLLLIVEVEASASAASVGLDLRAVGATSELYSTVQPFEIDTPVSNPSSQALRFDVPESGRYTIQLDDLIFPDPLNNLQAIVLDGPGGSVLGVLGNGMPLDLNLSAGDAPEVTIVATRTNDNDRSSYVLTVLDSGGAPSFRSVTDVGDFSEVAMLNLDTLTPAAETTVRVTDFGFPEPLTGLTAQYRDSAQVVATPIGAVTRVTPNGTDGQIVIAAASGATGAVGVRIDDAVGTVANTVVSLEPTPDFNAAAILETSLTVMASDQLTLEVRDFASPQAFDQVVAAVIRDGAIVAELPSAGVIAFDVTPGTYQISVIGTFDNPSAGTLGATVTASDDSVVFEASTQAGGARESFEIEITEMRRVRLTATDLGLPAPLESLSLSLTRGASLLGSILGGGSFDITLDPGIYEVGVVATPTANSGLGGYLFSVDALPDPPSVDLTISEDSVPVGGSITLTWSSERATDCTASGAWSGVRDTSGSETIANIQSTGDFRLECTGEGGSSSASVSVTVRAVSSVSGGGSTAPHSLLLFGLLLAWRYRPAAAKRSACS